MSESPVQWLEKRAQEHPDDPAVEWLGRTVTFREFLETVNAKAQELKESSAGAIFPVLTGSAFDLAVMLFAAPMAGKAFMPLDPRMPEAARQALLDLAAAVGPQSLSPPDPGAVQLVIATSGTTGTPKGVMLTGNALVASVRASRKRLPLNSGDTWLACLPMFHIGGLSILARCVEAGATVLLHDGFNEQAVLADLKRQEVTHLSLVPTMLFRLLEASKGAPAPKSLKVVLVGGAALSKPLAERARLAGWPIAPTYGMSETASQCATLTSLTAEWREGEVGPMLDGFDAAIEQERLKIRGPSLMAGYLNATGRLGSGLTDGWYITNDVAAIGDDGSLTILGRADDVINSGGEKIHPTVVESALMDISGISEVAVIGIGDSEWGESLVAVFTGQAGEKEVLAAAGEMLSGPFKPRRAVKVDHLPRNTLGKIDRKELKKIGKEKATLP